MTTTILHKDQQPSGWEPPSEKIIDLSGHGMVESWCCIDCGVNTVPGCSTRAEIEDAYRSPDYDPDHVADVVLTSDSEVYMRFDLEAGWHGRLGRMSLHWLFGAPRGPPAEAERLRPQ
jgi:hypothetical protein